MLEKNYNPKDFEEKIYSDWERDNDFKPDMRSDKDAFCVVIPPPNVTGVLHMGHALDDTLQDILIRYNRMQGKKVLWQPGMDHAGIATQMVVERNLAKEGITRHDLGREKFIETVWKWKEQSGGTICKQLRRLGASCDWSRERFTMDEGLSRAVRKIFVNLYKDGLIYKAKKLVNWDSKFMTAVSDLEVVQKETVGKMYYYKYPIENEPGQFIHIATTRPETMFGDTAVAVSKENEKLKHLIGKNAVLPIVNRPIPIVGDEHADPEKGTGAVKITPAHDFNDFEVGKRHNLPLINILNEDATLNENTPFPGMDTQTARAKTIEKLEELVYPLVAKIAAECGFGSDTILKFHKGNKQYPQPTDSQMQFDSLDKAISKIRVVLLVQIGKEGWDCRSLTGIILSQEGDCPKNMVLQTSCRCLRQVDKNAPETALIYLNDSNADKLNAQLQQQHRISLKEFTEASHGKTEIKRYDRTAYLKLPKIDFYQFKVNYETQTEEPAAPESKIPVAADEAKVSGDIIKTTDLTMETQDIKVDDTERGTEQATFATWLLRIVKGSFGSLTMQELSRYSDLLREVYLTVTAPFSVLTGIACSS